MIFQLFLTLLYTCAFASVPEDAKQQKRGIIGNDGWIGLPSPYGYGHGHPWTVDHTPWKGLKLPEINLHSCSFMQAIPIPVEHPIPIPVKHPVAVPVHHPYPVAIKHPVAVPVPVPVPVHSAPLSVPVHPAPLLAGGLAGAIYTRGYAPGHLFAPLHLHPSVHLHGHGVEALSHGFGHGIGHMLPHGYGHGYSPSYHDAHVDHLVHAHDHKKRKTDKN